ncbi:TPA: hypothetical protein ACUBGL_005484, partial [Escherichia coli]
ARLIACAPLFTPSAGPQYRLYSNENDFAAARLAVTLRNFPPGMVDPYCFHHDKSPAYKA